VKELTEDVSIAETPNNPKQS